MKIYKFYTTFTFGRYKGKTLEEVANMNASYIDWCLSNVKDFYITEDALKAVKEIVPSFHFSNIPNQKVKNVDYNNDYDDYNYHNDYSDYEDEWGGLSGEEAEAGYWNTQ